MELKTLSRDAGNMAGWTLRPSVLAGLSEGCEISSREKAQPCGCGIKLDLRDFLYPALRAAARGGRPEGVAGFGVRRDAHVHRGRLAGAGRLVIPAAALPARNREFASAMAAFGADTVIELFSVARRPESPAKERARIGALVKRKVRLLQCAASRLRESRGKRFSLQFGKGHSIAAGGDIMVFDLLRHEEAPGYTVSNNDTIATADSLLKHWSLISVFTSFNNALNDLFLMGVTKDLAITPVYDGTPRETALIRSAISAYRAFFARNGVGLAVTDRGPLRLGLKVVGATVSGTAGHEPPRLSGLLAGQDIYATRVLGDLSLLAMHRSLHFPFAAHRDVDERRLAALQHFTAPNYLAAGVLRRHLPAFGGRFDPARHITYAGDVSGPGLSVLEEAAAAGKSSVYVEDLRFVDERSLGCYRKDHTASTNGPILFSAEPRLAARVAGELKGVGLAETWRVGKVIKRTGRGLVFDPALKRRLPAACFQGSSGGAR